MISNKQWKIKWILGITFSILLLIVGENTAFADTLYSQSVNTTFGNATTSSGATFGTADYISEKRYDQRLGTGLNGTVARVAISYKVQTENLGGGNITGARIMCYDDAYITFNNGCSSSTSNFDRLTSTSQTATSTALTVIFDPTKYYVLAIGCTNNCYNGSGTNSLIQFAGDTTDSYSGGALVTYSPGFNIADLYFDIYNSSGSSIGQTTTRIDQVSPYHNQTLASTTPLTIEANGYINPDDAIEGLGIESPVKIKWNIWSKSRYLLSNECYVFFNCAPTAGSAVNSSTGLEIFSDTSSTSWGSQIFNISSSTTQYLEPGWYTLTTAIVKPITILGVSTLPFNSNPAVFGYRTYAATTTSFLVDQANSYDLQLNDTLGQTPGQNPLYASTTAEILSRYNDCNPLAFSLSGCLAILFVPNFIQIANTLDTLKTGVGATIPWGYVTRAYVIMTNNATTTLPTIDIDFSEAPTAEAGIAIGGHLTLDPWTNLMGSTSILGTATSTQTGNTFREIVEPGWNTFIVLSFLFLVFNDLVGRTTNTSDQVSRDIAKKSRNRV